MNVAPRQSFYHLSRRKLLVFGVVLLVAAAVYGIDGLRRNAPDTACAGAVKAAQRLSPLAHGEVAAFTVAIPSAMTRFHDPKLTKLAPTVTTVRTRSVPQVAR